MIPRMVFIEVTRKCNLGCKFCVLHKVRDCSELSMETLGTIIDQCIRMGVEHIQFTGGEPTLARHFRDAVQLALEGGMSVSVLTNGLEQHELLSAVAEEGASVVLSIDGPDIVHDRIRGRVGAWDQTVRLLAAMQDAGRTVSIQFTACADNLHCLEWFQDFVRVYDIRSIIVSAAALPGPQETTICGDLRAMRQVRETVLAIAREAHYHRTVRTNVMTPFQAGTFYDDPKRVLTGYITSTRDVYLLPYGQCRVWRVGSCGVEPLSELLADSPRDIHRHLYRSALERVRSQPLGCLLHELHRVGVQASEERSMA